MAVAGKLIVVQTADDRRRLGGTLHRWDGVSRYWFGSRGLIEDGAEALGVVETSVGVFTVAVSYDRTKLELSRNDVGALRDDRVPKVTFRRFAALLPLSDGVDACGLWGSVATRVAGIRGRSVLQPVAQVPVRWAET